MHEEKKARRVLALVLALLGLLGECDAALQCFPDYCKSVHDPLIPQAGYQCLLTPVKKGAECANFKMKKTVETFTDYDYIANFQLIAYVQDLGKSEKVTAFNLSISDINFHRLYTRYQYIVPMYNTQQPYEEDGVSACRQVELFGNASHPAPGHLYVSCPFARDTYEDLPYIMDFVAIGDDFAYYRKYIFYVPQHTRIADGITIARYKPFFYVDVSDMEALVVYVQQLPARYNVTKYKIWVVRNETNSVHSVILPAHEDGRHVRLNFSAPNGLYYVKVQAVHPDCGERGCMSNISPLFHIRRTSGRLLIMIISMIWIPPVLLYGLYHVFKFHRKRVLRGISRRPNCLLIYSPTHVAHVQVMEELTKYLQCCNINAMIDILNIRDIASQDPGIWCNTAFRAADVILVATSPPSTSSSYPNVYRNVDKHLLRLLKENYPQRNKRYYALHLPYCEADDIPEEARLFKMFRVPRDLRKLVKTIHGIGCLRFRSPRDNTGIPEILYSIQLAADLLVKEQNAVLTKNKTEETEDLLPTIVARETKSQCEPEPEPEPKPEPELEPVLASETDSPVKDINDVIPQSYVKDINDVIPQSFVTDINELNLLGENDEKEIAKSIYPARNDYEFRIDGLKL